MAVSQKDIKEIFDYNPDTGAVTWIKVLSSRTIVGKPVGVKLSCGHLQVTIDYKRYLVHRLIWLYVYGVWPKDQIDHINHIPDDNRISNLRETTQKENMINKSLQKKNTSGANGVRWYANLNKWRVSIGLKGNYLHLGYFTCKNKAVARRKTAEVLLGYHSNHGGA